MVVQSCSCASLNARLYEQVHGGLIAICWHPAASVRRPRGPSRGHCVVSCHQLCVADSAVRSRSP